MRRLLMAGLTKALRIAMPEAPLARADQVIE